MLCFSLVLSAPQGRFAQRGTRPADILVRWAMCCAAVPLQDKSNRFTKPKTPRVVTVRIQITLGRHTTSETT